MAGDLEGAEAQVAALRQISQRIISATPEAVDRAGQIVMAYATQLLSLTSHAPGTPTPSAPGSPPSLISGNLRRSMVMDGPTRRGANAWSVSVSNSAVYARIQEKGGAAGRGAQLPPRPYLGPALRMARPAIAELIRGAWGDAL